MNILVCTNTFTPHVGGVARSVQQFTEVYRGLGHRVLVAAPRFEDAPEQETDVVRFPALQNFNGSDFSVPLPVPGILAASLDDLDPDLVHSHHPFLLGDTALRIAAARDIPIVFTHHTMYEQYTHYVPGDSPRMQRFAIDLATGYGNLCDVVIAPSESVAEILLHRGVTVPIEVIPTGVDRARLQSGDRTAGRRRAGIPPEAFVVGHVGRLAPEKNLDFLARALTSLTRQDREAMILVVGDGPSRNVIQAALEQHGLGGRLVMTGILEGRELADAYASMDVFAFASRSETQGMVLAEAMTTGVPVVALDAPGVREVVRDRYNGRLLPEENMQTFVQALHWIRSRSIDARATLGSGVAETAERFSIQRTARRALVLYEELVRRGAGTQRLRGDLWATARRRLGEEWKIVKNIGVAAGDAWKAPKPEDR